jgi:hypothetical protein
MYCTCFLLVRCPVQRLTPTTRHRPEIDRLAIDDRGRLRNPRWRASRTEKPTALGLP